MRFNPKSLVLLFTYKGSLIKRLLGGMSIITLITVVLCYLQLEGHISILHLSNTLPGYMGAALGLLLVFRNNTAYDKWWEARKELGALVNVSRNMAISLNGLLPPNHPEKFRIAHLLTTFVNTMRSHLGKGVVESDLKELNTEDHTLVSQAVHKPVVVANMMMSRIEWLWKEKLISDMQQYLLMTKIHTMVDVLGKCERIKNTPIPMAYGFLLKFFIILYVMILPFGLLDDLGWWSVPLVIILYYILMSIVLTAEEIEEPFGKDLNDLPFDEMAENIQQNVHEIVRQD
ncbi:MAG: bestrophin family protein [Cytophagaceae bacterium]